MPIHIRAKAAEVAPVVLLPGDPDRAAHIAEQHLEGAVCYNDYRQLRGFTGRVAGLPVSVQATGMGAPSAAIVVEELIQLGARVLVRIGTCGAVGEGIGLGDLVAVQSALGLNGATRELTGSSAPVLESDPALVRRFVGLAAASDLRLHTGQVATLDLFYDPDREKPKRLADQGILALEMEASLVLALAARHGLRAACLLTVSDLVEQDLRADPDLIRTGVDSMTELALRALVAELV